MHSITLEIYNKYSDDLIKLINHFTTSSDRTLEVMNNLEIFIKNESAVAGGHIIDNKLVSFVWCYEREFGGSKRLHISYFIVAEGYRGRGLSSGLLNFSKTKAEELDIQFIDLNVDPQNEKAIKVYEKSGFNTEKLQLVMKVSKGDDDV